MTPGIFLGSDVPIPDVSMCSNWPADMRLATKCYPVAPARDQLYGPR